jgi:hypothetical protein
MSFIVPLQTNCGVGKWYGFRDNTVETSIVRTRTTNNKYLRRAWIRELTGSQRVGLASQQSIDGPLERLRGGSSAEYF